MSQVGYGGCRSTRRCTVASRRRRRVNGGASDDGVPGRPGRRDRVRDRSMDPLVRHAGAHRDHRPPGDADRRRHRCRRGPPTPRTDRARSRCSAPARTWTTRIRTSGPPWILIARWAVTTRRASTSRRRSTAPTSSWSAARAARLGGSPPSCNAPPPPGWPELRHSAMRCSSPICTWIRTVASNSSSPPRGTDRTGCEPTSTRRRCSCGSSSVLPTMWSSWNWRSRTSPVVPRCRGAHRRRRGRRPRSGDSHVRVAPPPVPGRDAREGGLDQCLHDRRRCADERRGRSAGRQRGGRPVAHRAGRSADRHGRPAAAVRVLGRPGGQRLV